MAREHVLLPFAGVLQEADADLAPLLTPEVLRGVLGLVPDDWLRGEPGFKDPDEVRSAYVDYLSARLEEPRAWVQALEDARDQLV
jgi:hypothetical protein